MTTQSENMIALGLLAVCGLIGVLLFHAGVL